MVELKPSWPTKGNESKIPANGNKVKYSKPKNYRGEKPQNKPSPDPEFETDFQGRCTDLKGYTFDLGPRVSDKSARTNKELERYLWGTYSEIFQPAIMTETSATLIDPEMPTITDLGTKCPKTDGEMTYAKSWGIRMYTNQAFTIYIITLWAKQTNNYKRRRRRTPPSRRSRLTKTR